MILASFRPWSSNPRFLAKYILRRKFNKFNKRLGI